MSRKVRNKREIKKETVLVVGGIIGVIGIVLILVCELFLNALLPRSTYTVYQKQFLSASTETVGSFLFPKTAEYVYPDRWCILTIDEHGAMDAFYVSEPVYNDISAGDTYIYTPSRGDMDNAPCAKKIR